MSILKSGMKRKLLDICYSIYTKYTVHAKKSQVHWGQLIATSELKCICFLASQRGVFIEAALYSRQESLKEFCHIRELRERCIVLLKRDLEREREEKRFA